MKYAFGLLILTVTLIATSQTGAVASHDTQALASAASSVAEPVAEFCSTTESNVELQSTAATLPYCGNYDDLACSTPGATFRCQWAPFEPGRCWCQDNYVWSCG